MGGAAGAVSRFIVSVLLRSTTNSGFPWATFGVNLMGCLLMGLLMGWLWRLPPETSETLRLVLGVGVLGGFTTFSAFSLELFQLLERRDVLLGAFYAGGSVIGGVLAFAAGYYFVRAFVS
ncbi:MAG: fluoride efflux transporter CrcB [Rhodobiaceae bacterium]|nr:fluoride efflux transporter CrcB [Rhodobiaceae bacterium]